MNDERIERALREIGDRRLPASADGAIRSRIQEEWTATAPRHGFRWPAQLLALAAAVLITIGLGSAALGAGADSVLWPARVAIEDFGLSLRVTAEARADYLLDLIDARTTEAARQEAAGHALAAGKALAAREDALKHLSTVATKNEPPRTIPPLPSVFKSPEASRTPEPTKSAELTRSPEPTKTIERTPEPTKTPDRTPEPTKPAEPTFSVAPTPFRTPELTRSPLPPTTTPPNTAITITGTVRYEDGTIPLKACISTSSVLASTACGTFAENGVYSIKTTSLTVGVTIRLYAYATERGLYGGSESAVATSPTTVMPPITLRPLSTSSPTPTPVKTTFPTKSPTPTVATGEYVILTGQVRYDDGTIPTKACISTSPTLPTTCAGFAENGTFTIKAFVASTPVGSTVRLYAYATERGALWGGSEIAVITSPTTTFPTIVLHPQALPSPTPTASPL